MQPDCTANVGQLDPILHAAFYTYTWADSDYVLLIRSMCPY